tara:strand:- start:70 stop:468 length:399 start_codon:yes stop_codon:yes gene_type:complete
MKKLLFILLTTFLSSGIYAQGNNLQFSQVIFNEFTATTNSGWVSAGTLTVGTNKVLKITSASAGRSGSQGGTLKIGSHYLVNTSNTTNTTTFPIWLPAGTYDVQLYYYQGGYQPQPALCNGTISGVEFNIVQ